MSDRRLDRVLRYFLLSIQGGNVLAYASSMQIGLGMLHAAWRVSVINQVSWPDDCVSTHAYLSLTGSEHFRV